MVWSLEDFIREIRRQLVELEALRKKMHSQDGGHENLERLEESQRYLLRKLNQYFDSLPKDRPYLEEKCRACGKLLVPSVLAGDPIIRDGGSWYHKRCHEADGEFGRRYSLN